MYNDELYHYGVLGMKWGVKHDRSKAINKSYKKLSNLDSDISKKTEAAKKAAIKTATGASKKYSKLEVKADKLQAKADKKKYGFFTNERKANELQADADKAQFKANKYKARAEKRAQKARETNAQRIKAENKAKKWASKMNKYLNDTKISELNNEQIALAKKYLGM